MEAQAAALGLRLHHVLIPKDTTDYKAAYVTGMRALREEHGITVMATGDMDLVGSMARNWIEECGEEAGIRAYLPLWQADRAACLTKLCDEGFVVRFSCVKSPWFDGSWIGRTIDRDVLSAMEALCDAPIGDAKPLDLGGAPGKLKLSRTLRAQPRHSEHPPLLHRAQGRGASITPCASTARSIRGRWRWSSASRASSSTSRAKRKASDGGRSALNLPHPAPLHSAGRWRRAACGSTTVSCVDRGVACACGV
eukprot:5506168-Prymnesium_polylepis.1